MVYWLCQLGFLPWSVISISKGFEADFSDERRDRLRTYEHLQVRLWTNMLFSPLFGIPTWIFALYPWLPLHYHRRFFELTKQMIFAKPQIEVAFRSFLREFELYAPRLGIQPGACSKRYRRVSFWAAILVQFAAAGAFGCLSCGFQLTSLAFKRAAGDERFGSSMSETLSILQPSRVQRLCDTCNTGDAVGLRSNPFGEHTWQRR